MCSKFSLIYVLNFCTTIYRLLRRSLVRSALYSTIKETVFIIDKFYNAPSGLTGLLLISPDIITSGEARCIGAKHDASE